MAKSRSKQNPVPYGRGSGIPNPVDIHVGKRIRVRRRYLGMNQESLGKSLGLTFQQVQKYENGNNRVSASKLAEIAAYLRVPISFFFDGLPPKDTPANADARLLRERNEQSKTIDLIRHYDAIADGVRKEFLGMVKAIAASRQ